MQPLTAKGHGRGFFQINYHFTVTLVVVTRDGLLRHVFVA